MDLFAIDEYDVVGVVVVAVSGKDVWLARSVDVAVSDSGRSFLVEQRLATCVDANPAMFLGGV